MKSIDTITSADAEKSRPARGAWIEMLIFFFIGG